MIRRFLRKYDWVKIGGLLGILAIDVLVVLGIVALFSPAEGKAEEVVAEQSAHPGGITLPGEEPRFRMPAVPITITDAEARAGYLSLHWWDHFNFSDTACIHRPGITEQAFVDFIDILPIADAKSAAGGIHTLLEHTAKDETGSVYRYFLDKAETYLYHPNSPFRNEELYAPFLEHALQCDRNTDAEKIRPRYQLEDINKNRRGTIAADFSYTLADGGKGRLHTIRAEYTLLYFHDPDCPDCKRTKGLLEQSPLIAGLIDTGALKILALYTDGEAAAWEACRNLLPDSWLNACDGHEDLPVREKLYAIRAIPSLYLLDRDKRVILKDTDYTGLEAWMREELEVESFL